MTGPARSDRQPPRAGSGRAAIDEHYVDIYREPGITLRAGPVLELAERHGVRGTVELLLPYTVTGPGYVRGVFAALRTALRMLQADRIDSAAQRRRADHRPSRQLGS